MIWVGHVLDHVSDHLLDHIIIGLVTTALYFKIKEEKNNNQMQKLE